MSPSETPLDHAHDCSQALKLQASIWLFNLVHQQWHGGTLHRPLPSVAAGYRDCCAFTMPAFGPGFALTHAQQKLSLRALQKGLRAKEKPMPRYLQ